MQYIVNQTAHAGLEDQAFDSPAWEPAEVARIDHFHPRSSAHRPVTRLRMLRHGRSIHFRFRVDDRFVRCVRTGLQQAVCNDSCVEVFIQPRPDRGYFNFEFNCGGAMLLYYIEDASRGAETPFKRYQVVPDEQCRLVPVRSTLPPQVDPEIEQPLTWELGGTFPLELFEAFVGAMGEPAGQEWRGNFYKCGDQTSHPHWASWAPIGAELNFHQPDLFQPIRLS